MLSIIVKLATIRSKVGLIGWAPFSWSRYYRSLPTPISKECLPSECHWWKAWVEPNCSAKTLSCTLTSSLETKKVASLYIFGLKHLYKKIYTSIVIEQVVEKGLKDNEGMKSHDQRIVCCLCEVRFRRILLIFAGKKIIDPAHAIEEYDQYWKIICSINDDFEFLGKGFDLLLIIKMFN